MKEQLKKLSKESLKFLEDSFGIHVDELDSFTEEQYDELYDRLCDIEVEEKIKADDEPLSDRGRMASDLVTILGEVCAQEWESIGDEMNSGTSIMAVSDDVIAAATEPDAEWTPEEIRKWYHQHHTEAGLAQTYAVVSNNFWWVEDDVYDFEEGTPEYQEACRITDAWGNLLKELEVEIFSLLKNEGWEIPESGTLEVLVPFMVRNGYYYNIGWWEPKEE